jgi:hypothetical protein
MPGDLLPGPWGVDAGRGAGWGSVGVRGAPEPYKTISIYLSSRPKVSDVMVFAQVSPDSGEATWPKKEELMKLMVERDIEELAILGCSIVLQSRGRASGAGFGPVFGPRNWCERTQIRSHAARAFGPGCLGSDFGPFSVALRPKDGPTPAPETRPGDPEHY